MTGTTTAGQTDGASTTVTASYVLYLYAESPVRAGGDDDTLVDLPIQRDGITGWPVIHGQSLKGALREHLGGKGWNSEELTSLLGTDVEPRASDGSTTPGRIVVGEAQVVALPVPTTVDIFAWVTCPTAIHRLNRTRSRAGFPPLPVPSVEPRAVVCSDAAHAAESIVGPVILEPSQRVDVGALAEGLAAEVFGTEICVLKPFSDRFATHLLLGGDEIGSLLLQTAPGEVTRNHVGASKTTPFDEEFLPEESILAAAVSVDGAATAVVDKFKKAVHGQIVRIGADRSVGKGLMWARLVEGPSEVGTTEAGAQDE